MTYLYMYDTKLLIQCLVQITKVKNTPLSIHFVIINKKQDQYSQPILEIIVSFAVKLHDSRN